MAHPIFSLLYRPRRVAPVLVLIVVSGFLIASPDRRLQWLLPSVSATATASDESTGDDITALASGSISFTAPGFTVNEDAGVASLTVARTGGSDGTASAIITLTDVTASPADYIVGRGSLDPTFITPSQVGSGSASTYSYPTMALQPDGKLLVADIRGVWRLNPNGSVDTTFNASNATNAVVNSVALQADGKVIIGGAFTTVNNQRANRVARLNSDGSLDTTFDVGTGASSDDVKVVLVQADGKVLVLGDFGSFNGTQKFGLVRLNSDGSVDASYVGSLGGFLYSMVLQPDGKALVGGSGGVRRVNTDGTIDATFNTQFSGTWPLIFNVAVQPDGKVLIVGVFDHVGGQVAYGVARLNADGSVDPSFNAGTGPDSTPQGLALQPDGKVLVGGGFNSFNGVAVNDLVRLNADGSLDSTFAPNILSQSSDRVNNVFLQPDGRILIRGSFTASGSNINNSNLARLRNDLFVTWTAGDANNKTVTLPIVNDLLDEPDETLNLTLIPFSGTTVGATSSATLTIVDNDVPPTITSAPPSLINAHFAFSHTFTATGSPAPTFRVTTGSLPPGIFLQSSGLLSGTASPSSAGTYNVTVTASNGVAPDATQSFSLRVNAAPASNDNFYTAIQNTPLTVPAPGVLGNDTDANGDPLTAELLGNPLHGTISFNSNGSFVYTPATNFLGIDSFSYRASDGNITSSITSVFITVAAGGTLQFSASAYSRPEDSGSATITVTRAIGSAGEVRVNYATSDGTATAGSDYSATSGTLVFPQGVVSQTFTIPLIADTTREPDETVNLTLSDAQGTGTMGSQSTAVLTITDDDTPRLQFGTALYSLSETVGAFNITVIRTGRLDVPVSVNYASSDTSGLNNCNPTFSGITGLASSRCDYSTAVGTLRFAAGETSKTFSLIIVDDVFLEGPESFNLSLSNPTGEAVLGAINSAVVRLIDGSNDGSTVNPVDTTAFFVTQNYIDFLGRLPDPAGFTHFSNTIDNCQPVSASCDRIEVSRAIFVSPEFRDRGYFVYKFYAAALGRFPHYDEFMLDRARVSGFQSDAELEQSKLDFIADFMNRQEFRSIYDSQTAARAFVEAVLAKAGVTLANKETLISQLQSGSLTRAAVLKAIIESAEVDARFFNEATIVMHYFGYLRRDPDALYQHWVDVLRDTGNFRTITSGFANSAEYRFRFGQ